MKLPLHRLFENKTKLRLVRLMQLVLFGVLVAGLYEQNPGVVVNGIVSLALTFLPAYLARNHNIVMSPAIVLWITTAVSLHALGSMGLYRVGTVELLGITFGWDSMTHALSASIVAGVGYATVRVLHEYDDDIHLPPRFMSLFIIIFVMAFGVFWEVLEFLIAESAALFNITSVLTQYGLNDTIKDMMFNMVGAVVFSVLGIDHVRHVIEDVHERLEYHKLMDTTES